MRNGATLFLNDATNNELYSRSMTDHGPREIRFPDSMGIAGTVFTSGETINIPHADAD